MSVLEGWLNPAIDRELHRDQLQRTGRTQICSFLHPRLTELITACLRNEVPWGIAYQDGGIGRAILRQEWLQMPEEERNALYRQVCSEARTKFQYWYQTYMMVSAFLAGREPSLFLHQVVQWINAEEFLSLGRELSQSADIRKADAQATAYVPGCFLNTHNDTGAPQGHERRMAYVMSFTADWKSEWGGLLQFLNDEDEVVETLMPRYNTLNLFLTPQPHAVTFVAPYAAEPRLSITGWFRAD